LDIGTASVSFNNTGGTWGAVTLTEKITSNNQNIQGSNVSERTGTLTIKDDVSVTSIADIVNTASNAYTIYYNSTGTVSISGGTVSATGTNGMAVVHHSSSKLTVSGTAKVTSANGTLGTIYLADSGTSTAVRLEITGGMVENTAANGLAVINFSTGAINISGDTLTGKDGISNHSTGAVNISGGTVENTATGSGCAIYNASTGAVTISGGTVTKAGRGGYVVYATTSGKVTITSPPAVITGRRYNC